MLMLPANRVAALVGVLTGLAGFITGLAGVLPGQWPSRGGFLGNEHDAFKTGDPAGKVPDISRRVSTERDKRRLDDLHVLEEEFGRRRRLRRSRGNRGS